MNSRLGYEMSVIFFVSGMVKTGRYSTIVESILLTLSEDWLEREGHGGSSGKSHIVDLTVRSLHIILGYTKG